MKTTRPNGSENANSRYDVDQHPRNDDRLMIKPFGHDQYSYQQQWFAQTYPEARLTINLADQEPIVDRRRGVAVQEATQNAAKHADAGVSLSISVAVEDDREQVQIDIEDDGPDIPGHELKVIQSGVETPPTHRSGIGFWFMYWMVDSSAVNCPFNAVSRPILSSR